MTTKTCQPMNRMTQTNAPRRLACLAALYLCFVLTESSAYAQSLGQAQPQPTARPTLPSPLLKVCASYGYTCADGYKCTLETRSLGVPSYGRSFAPVYACAMEGLTHKDGCQQGWASIGGNVTGEYTCKPLLPLCRAPDTFPWPAPGYAGSGYFCLSKTPSRDRY